MRTQKTFQIVIEGKTISRTYAVEHEEVATAEQVYAALEEQANQEAANMRRHSANVIEVFEVDSPRHKDFLRRQAPEAVALVKKVEVETGRIEPVRLETKSDTKSK